MYADPFAEMGGTGVSLSNFLSDEVFFCCLKRIIERNEKLLVELVGSELI